MPIALLATVKPPLIQILNANRLAYSANVGVGANASGAYPFDPEVTDAVIRADGHIIVEGYFKSPGNLKSAFMQTSANLPSGSPIPKFVGFHGKLEYSLDGIDWKVSTTANKSDIVGAGIAGAYVRGGASPFVGHHFLDEGEGIIYHTSPYFRMAYPQYVRSTVLQADQNDEQAIIAQACAFLYKNNSNAAFEYYTRQADMLLGLIRQNISDVSNIAPQGPMPTEQ